jgi:hypothetical protein
MPRQLKDYVPLIKKLNSIGASPSIPKNHVYGAIIVALFNDQNQDLSPEDAKAFLRYIGVEISSHNMTRTMDGLASGNILVKNDNGRYNLAPGCISPDLKIPSLEELAELQHEERLSELNPLLLYVGSLAYEGKSVFSKSSCEFLKAKEKVEKEPDSKKSLGIMIEELKLSKETGKYIMGLRRRFLESGVKIPFVDSDGKISQVTELLHDAGIELLHGCFDCGYHQTDCKDRERWDICHEYLNEQSLIASMQAKAEIIRAKAEEFKNKRTARVRENLEDIVEKMGVPGTIYSHATKMFDHLVNKDTSEFVQRTAYLDLALLNLAAIDIGMEDELSLSGDVVFERRYFSESFSALARELHENGFHLSHGCSDCDAYNGHHRECKTASGPKQREPYDICIAYTRGGRTRILHVAAKPRPIQTANSAPVVPTSPTPTLGKERAIKTPTPIALETGESTQEGEEYAFSMLVRHQGAYYYPRAGEPCSIKDLEKLVEKGFAKPAPTKMTRAFQVTKEGLEEDKRGRNEEMMKK